MFNFNNWRAVSKAYSNNTGIVRDCFDGFFSPGLISRMCCELYTSGSFECCETALQVSALTQCLHGIPVQYRPEQDPELAEVH